MSTKALVIGTIGAGCLAAAGIGGFVAARMSPAPAAQSGEPAIELPAAPATTEVPAEAAAPVDPPAAAVATTRVQRAAPQPERRAAAAAPAPAAPAPSRPLPAPVETPPPPPPDPGVWTPASSADPVVSLPPVDPGLPAPLPEPPRPEPSRFIEVTVEEDAVIGIRLETSLSSDTARIEDRVVARVTRDVMVDGRTAIPAGARLEGNVTLVDTGGRFRERARLGVQFTRLVLSDDSSVRLQTETIFRDGDSPTGEATSKVGASAVIGAILGGVIGGKKGAVIGGSAGAAGGTAAVMASGPNAVTLEEGTPLTVRLTQPVTLLVERFDPIR